MLAMISLCVIGILLSEMSTVQNKSTMVLVQYFAKYIVITYTGIVFERHKRFKVCHLYFEVSQ